MDTKWRSETYLTKWHSSLNASLARLFAQWLTTKTYCIAISSQGLSIDPSYDENECFWIEGQIREPVPWLDVSRTVGFRNSFMSIFPCSSTGLSKPASFGPSSVLNASDMSKINCVKFICGMTRYSRLTWRKCCDRGLRKGLTSGANQSLRTRHNQI